MNLGQIDWFWIVVNVVVLLFSLSLHESAHAWAADYFGDSTARSMGRVSLNPIVHIDPVGSLLFPLIGLVMGGVIFGWAKPVPVVESRLRNQRVANMAIAAAGPGSNILAAIGFLVGLKLLTGLSGVESGGWGALEPLLLLCQVGLILNLILAVFNLIPIPPLDGSWILIGVLPRELSRYIEMVRPYGFLLLLGLLYTGVIGSILRPILGVVAKLIAS